MAAGLIRALRGHLDLYVEDFGLHMNVVDYLVI
jgi:hypothetical protein